MNIRQANEIEHKIKVPYLTTLTIKHYALYGEVSISFKNNSSVSFLEFLLNFRNQTEHLFLKPVEFSSCGKKMLILLSWILTFMKKKRLNIYFKDPQKRAYVIHYVSFLIEQNLFLPRTFFSYLVRKFPSFPFHKIIAFCSGLQIDCSD